MPAMLENEGSAHLLRKSKLLSWQVLHPEGVHPLLAEELEILPYRRSGRILAATGRWTSWANIVVFGLFAAPACGRTQILRGLQWGQEEGFA